MRETGSGWKNRGEEKQQDGLAGRAAGKLCDGHSQRWEIWGMNMLKLMLVKI